MAGTQEKGEGVFLSPLWSLGAGDTTSSSSARCWGPEDAQLMHFNSLVQREVRVSGTLGVRDLGVSGEK